MPSKKQYNLVHNDDYDTRIPLHSEEAFHRGIIFHAKFIGSLEVPRPTSRVEIVAAMRKIRYEFKAKGIKKKKVTIQVSVDGLKVTLRKKKKKQEWMDENKMFLMHHPIYRIFYVSHDSHDLKIFSYIARDGNSNAFKCNVFKSSKKSQAMRVVRTVGQAFEVCHKLSLNSAPEDRDRESGQRDLLHPDDDYEDQDESASDRPPPTPPSIHKDISLLVPSIDTEDTLPEITSTCALRSQEVPTTTVSTTPMRESPLQHGTITSDCGMLVGGELTALKHEIQLLRERLEQQCQQTRAAGAHARLLEGQLAAETAARVEAQTRTHQLLMQNKELLEHIGALVGHLREQERTSNHVNPTVPGTTGVGGGAMSATPTVPDLSTLGQPQRARAPGSPWELDTPSIALYPYSTEPIYSPNTVMSSQGFNSSSEQLSFQNQLLERLHSISAYQAQRSPYATPSPYPMGTNLLLRPSNSRPSVNSSQPSPNSTSLRVSQANSFSSSPVMVHKLENYASSNMDSNGEEQQQLQQHLQQQLQQQQLQQQQLQLQQQQQQQQFQQQLQQNLQQQQQNLHHQHQQQQTSEQQQQQSAFIKPLPQAQTTSSILSGDIDPRPRFTISDEPPPIILDPPPPGRKSALNNRNRNSENLRSLNSVTTESGATTPEGSENGASSSTPKPQESQKNFVHFSRTPGPPPSRTTSAKLPSRSETMSQVQRTTWARHTTK